MIDFFKFFSFPFLGSDQDFESGTGSANPIWSGSNTDPSPDTKNSFVGIMKTCPTYDHYVPVLCRSYQVNPNPVQDLGFWWPKFYLFWLEIAIYLSLGLLKRRPSYRRSLQPSKRKHRTLQKMKFINIFVFLWVILPSWIRSQSGSGFITLPVIYV
jgi:hypothetical protein